MIRAKTPALFESARRNRPAAGKVATISAVMFGLATWCAAQSGPSERSSPRTGMLPPAAASPGTTVLPTAYEIWRTDGIREERKENEYWSTFREKEAARLRRIYRAETERLLQTARARGEAFGRWEEAERRKKQAELPAADADSGSALPGLRDTANSLRQGLAGAATTATKAAQSASQAVSRTVNDAARLIEGQFSPRESRAAPGTSALILALLAIFLVPGIAAILLYTASRNLLEGRKLRAASFGATGLVLGALFFSLTLGQGSADGWEELRAECLEQALTVTAIVLEASDSGAVLANLRSSGGKIAATDQEGRAFLFTRQPEQLPAGTPLECTLYPVGNQEVYLAGSATALPAYTDSLETALDYRAGEAEGRDLWETLSRIFRES